MPLAGHGVEPSFDCSAVREGSIEALACSDTSLAALDNRLAKFFSRAKTKATNEHPPTLISEQRGWIKGRNACWKSEDAKDCVRESYQSRIAELEARYRLVEATDPAFFSCDGNPAKEVVVTFFETEPKTAIAEFGDRSLLMFLEESGSGAKYRGRNESLWTKGNKALVTWGYGGVEMDCEKSALN